MSKDFLGKLDLIKFIDNVEKQANEGTPNGKIDTAKEKSVFEAELKKYNLSEKDYKEIWGYATTGETNSLVTKAPAKAKTAGATSAPMKKATSSNTDNKNIIIININNDITLNININVDSNDKIAEEVAKAIQNLQDNIIEKLGDIIDQLLSQNFDISKIENLLQQISEKLTEQGQSIDNLNETILNYAKMNFEVLTNMGFQMENIANAITNVSDNQQKQYELMYAIYQTVNKLEKTDTKEIQNLLNNITEILNDIKTGGDVKIDEVIKLLTSIKSDTSENKEYNKNIFDAINKFGAEGVQIGNQILDAIKDLGDKGDEFANAVLTLLNQNNVELDDIKKLLALIQQDTSENKATSKEILEVVKQIKDKLGELSAEAGDALTNIFNAIVNNGNSLDEVNKNLADIKELLKAIKTDTAENKELSQKILAAIEELGTENTANFTAILNAINDIKAGGGDNAQLEALLQKVLDKMDENTAAIIEAMANIKVEGGTVDLSGIEKMLAELLKLTENNGYLLEDIDGKLETINLTIDAAKNEILAKMDKNNQAIVDIANEISKKLDNIGNKVDGNSQEILAQLKSITTILNNIDSKAYDDTALMQKLDDILKAIQDHKVVVDVTGKVSCDCNCDNNGGSHEGILDDLVDNLNATRSANAKLYFAAPMDEDTTGIGDVTTNNPKNNGSKKVAFNSNNQYGLPAGTYIIRNNDIYDMSGRKVAVVNE